MRPDSYANSVGEGLNPGRREFGKLALAGALGGSALLKSAAALSVHQSAPGIKLCAQVIGASRRTTNCCS